MTHAEKHIRNLKILEERNKGRKMADIAEEFGLHKGGVGYICKQMGARVFKAPPDLSNVKMPSGRDHNRWHEDDELAAIIGEKLPDWEYAGNYTGTDGTADIKCRTCGAVVTRSWTAIRHGRVKCRICERRQTEERQAKREAQRQAEAAERERIRKEQAEEKQRLAEERERQKEKICVVCGQSFKAKCSHQICCSPECSRRRLNGIHDKRLSRYGQKENGITLAKLYRRDRGICYICGRTCDLKDKITDERGTIICGNTYPSIDHVIPLSLGGPNTWDNVKLACRGCNTAKGAASGVKMYADGRLAINL